MMNNNHTETTNMSRCCGRYILFALLLTAAIFSTSFIYSHRLVEEYGDSKHPSASMKIISTNRHITELAVGYPETKLKFRIDYNSNDVLLSRQFLTRSLSSKTVRADWRLAHRGMQFDDIARHHASGHIYGIERFRIEQFTFELGVFYVEELYVQSTQRGTRRRSVGFGEIQSTLVTVADRYYTKGGSCIWWWNRSPYIS
jgi:hypothetical protein